MKSTTQTTGLIFACLIASVGEAVAKETKEGHALASRYPLQQNDLISIAYPPVPLNNSFSPLVDEKFIINRIIGPLPEAQRITNLIFELRDSHPKIKKYIDFVYTQLKQFQIICRQDIPAGQRSGVYIPSLRTLFVFNHSKIDDAKLQRTLRHEFRHAAMHAMHYILDRNGHNLSCEPYYPDTKEAAEAARKAFEAGEKNLKELTHHLYLETLNQLSKTEKTKLENLRAKCQQEYDQYYQTTVTQKITSEQLSMLKEDFDGFKLKQIYPSIMFRFNYGNLRLEKISKTQQDHYDLLFTFCDPLRAAVYNYEKLKARVQNKDLYKEDDFLLEMEAYLYGNLPLTLVKYLWSKWTRDTNELIDQALQTPLSHYTPRLEYYGIETFDIKNFAAYSVEESMERAIQYAFDPHHIEEAKIRLQELINRGHQVEKANLLLARLTYQEKNYHNAVKYFKRADKKKVNLTAKDRLQYASALHHAGYYKTSAKEEKKAEQRVENRGGLTFSRI